MGFVGEDRISKLSDCLLHHILSFLSTKSAISTCILSKRWSYVWTSIPVLDFHEWRSPTVYTEKDYPLETNRFMNFVDRVLFLHEMPTIQKFYLEFDQNFDQSRVNAWITTLIRRKVEEVILSVVYMENSLVLPLCFFTCDLLTTLELEMARDYFVLNLPKVISSPRLKILRLTCFKFVDENLTLQFFVNCLALEELRLTNCNWTDLNCVRISSPTLKWLFIDSPSGLSLDNCRVNINAPNLLSLMHNDYVAMDYILHSFPSLVDADIDDAYEDIHHGNLVYEREKVKFLAVENVRTLFDFLQISPYLESLVFTEGTHDNIFDDEDFWTQNLVPQWLLLHLKSTEFHQFVGHRGEMEMVKLFLKTAKVLQVMTIKASSGSQNLNKMNVMEQLLMFPRGSTSCVVKFSSSVNI